jgi:hypothetical protein
MALHCGEHWYHVTIRNRISTLGDPPIFESLVWADVETLRRGRSLSESVRYVRAEDEEVLDSRSGIEDPRSGLVQTVGMYVVKNTNLATASRTVTRATCLLSTVICLD